MLQGVAATGIVVAALARLADASIDSNGTSSGDAAAPCDISSNAADSVYLLRSAFSVLAMQGGFSLLEAGSVHRKNKTNIMLKNLCDMLIGVLTWYLVGWGLAYGDDNGSGLYGTTQFAADNIKDIAGWTFQLSFAATAATIDSGAVAERMKFFQYLFLSCCTTTVIYPVAAHWVWHPDGWLAKEGFVDFAGSGVVHMLGACSALVSASILGPRRHRFPEPPSAGADSTTSKSDSSPPVDKLDARASKPNKHAPRGEFGLFGRGDRPAAHKYTSKHATEPAAHAAGLVASPVKGPPTMLAEPSRTILGGAAAGSTAAARRASSRELTASAAPIFGSTAPGSGTRGSLLLRVHGDDLIAQSQVVVGSAVGGHAGAPDQATGGSAVHGSERRVKFTTEPSDATQLMFGTLMLWISWYSFNAGSTLSVSDGAHAPAATAAINTSFGAAAGGIAGMTVSTLRTGHVKVGEVSLGVLAGLVSVTANCHLTPYWAAWLIGATGGVLACFTGDLLAWLRIDDPVGAVAVHGPPGLWAIMAAGLFKHDAPCNAGTEQEGAFMGGGFSPLWTQMKGAGAIIAWACSMTALVMFAMKYTVGVRVTEEEEEIGLDVSEHLVVYDEEDDTLEITALDGVGLDPAAAAALIAQQGKHGHLAAEGMGTREHRHPNDAAHTASSSQVQAQEGAAPPHAQEEHGGGSQISTTFRIRMPASRAGPEPFFMSSAPRPRRTVLLRVNSTYSHNWDDADVEEADEVLSHTSSQASSTQQKRRLNLQSNPTAAAGKHGARTGAQRTEHEK